MPARDAAATIGWALAGLAEQSFAEDWELVVVDDGSSDGTAALVRDSGISVKLVTGEGKGPARARNAGAAVACGRALAFLDADCRPAGGWLQAGTDALREAELVQGATYPDPASPLGPFDRTLWVKGGSGLFESANLFVRRELFESLGGFESWLGPATGKELGEDVLFGWRAVRCGARVGFCEGALVHHAVFSRGALEYVRERTRLRFFPPLVRRVPELRDEFLYHRWFLSRRSAMFDLALCAALGAAATRRPWPLLGLAPYLKVLSERAAGGPRHAARVVLADGLADAVGFASLLAGSVSSRSMLV